MFKADRARELLDQEGRTRKWLARELELTPGTLDQYLGGFQRPGKETIRKMAELLNADVSELDDELETDTPIPSEAKAAVGT